MIDSNILYFLKHILIENNQEAFQLITLMCDNNQF